MHPLIPAGLTQVRLAMDRREGLEQALEAGLRAMLAGGIAEAYALAVQWPPGRPFPAPLLLAALRAAPPSRKWHGADGALLPIPPPPDDGCPVAELVAEADATAALDSAP